MHVPYVKQIDHVCHSQPAQGELSDERDDPLHDAVLAKNVGNGSDSTAADLAAPSLNPEAIQPVADDISFVGATVEASDEAMLGSPMPTELDCLEPIELDDSPMPQRKCLCHELPLPDRQPIYPDEWPRCVFCEESEKILEDVENTQVDDQEPLAANIIAACVEPFDGYVHETVGFEEEPSTEDRPPLRRLGPLQVDPAEPILLDSPDLEPYHDQHGVDPEHEGDVPWF